MGINEKIAQDVWKEAGEHVEFVTLVLKREDQAATQEWFGDFVGKYAATIRSIRIRANEANVKVALGISRKAWDYLFPQASVPKELEEFTGLKSDKAVMPASEGDIFIHIRATKEAPVYEVLSILRDFYKEFATVVDETKGFRYLEGRAIIGFIDGTEAPEVQDAAEYALIGDEDPTFKGGAYAFTQKWYHDMDKWNSLSTETQEKAVGRRKYNDIELEDEEKFHNAHNVASKVEVDGEEQKIIRMNVAFSEPAKGITGTYFMGYAAHWEVTKAMLKSMLEKNDYLLTFSKIKTGQLFFIPSRELLDKIADGDSEF